MAGGTAAASMAAAGAGTAGTSASPAGRRIRATRRVPGPSGVSEVRQMLPSGAMRKAGSPEPRRCTASVRRGLRGTAAATRRPHPARSRARADRRGAGTPAAHPACAPAASVRPACASAHRACSPRLRSLVLTCPCSLAYVHPRRGRLRGHTRRRPELCWPRSAEHRAVLTGWVHRAGFTGLGSLGCVHRAGLSGLRSPGWALRAGLPGLRSPGWAPWAAFTGVGSLAAFTRGGLTGPRRTGC